MKKLIRNTIAILLAVIFATQASVTAFAAGSKTEYVSDVILSYGKTDDEAKKWLTDNGYTVVDNNLNEGATDKNIFATEERSVYLGYKTTTDSSKAITDMKLMNMKGGYSVQDYQTLLTEQASNISIFISDFIATLNEYRENYKSNDERAINAYNVLNMFYDDDADENLGDLFLNKIKEEYTSKEWDALSAEEQKKHADMTTILMQGNSEIVLTIEQTLATATDTNDNLWIERCSGADSYDDMLDELVDKYGDVNKASDELDEKYGDTAESIADMVAGYKEYISDYVDGSTHITDSSDEVQKYVDTLSNTKALAWYMEATQYEVLSNTKLSDGTTLLDLMTMDDATNNVEEFYPLAEALTSGEKACVGFLLGYQFVSLGYTSNENANSVKNSSIKNVDLNTEIVSVFDGIDRTIYNEDVALTGDAYALQTAGEDKDYSDNWLTGGVSTTTAILAICTGVTMVASIASFITSASITVPAGSQEAITNLASATAKANNSLSQYNSCVDAIKKLGDTSKIREAGEAIVDHTAEIKELEEQATYWQDQNVFDSAVQEKAQGVIDSVQASPKFWKAVFKYAGIALTVATIILTATTLWQTYENLKKYYSADFTTIPSWMVDESSDQSTFTYYKAVKCNRIESNFATDQTKLMGDYGDINGDVGKQWVALYTTTDTEAGKPILANSFTVQYANNTIPNDSVALSLFDESVAQNLTNEKKGFTYADKKGGIYMFYEVKDTNAFTASSISTIGWIGIGVAGVAIIAGIAFAITKTKKKKEAK